MSKSPGNDPIVAEIQAEIDDHLATAAEKLQSQGLATDEARQKSQAKFGDPAMIGRRCYWIKQGDALMFRTAIIVLLSLLCVALGFVAYGGYRSQRQMAEQMVALAEQLKLLADQQKAVAVIPPPAEPKPLEITGKVFIGSPEKPAANANLTLIDLKDGSRVRNFRADDEGHFKSGPLGGGDYALLTDTAEKLTSGGSTWAVQSAPIAAYPGVAIPPQQIDIEHHVGLLVLETTRPLPHRQVEGRYTIDSRLLLRVLAPQDRNKSWTRDLRQPKTWPIYVATRPGGTNAVERGGFTPRTVATNYERNFYAILSQEELTAGLAGTIFRDSAGRFGVGEVTIAVAIITDIIPADYKRPSLDAVLRGTGGFSDRISSSSTRGSSMRDANAPSVWAETQSQLQQARNSALDRDVRPATYDRTAPRYDGNDEFYWLTKGLGNIWLDHLSGKTESEARPYPHIVSPKWLILDQKSTVPIEAGKATRLQIEVPADLEAKIQELVETNDAERFSKLTLGDDSVDHSRSRNAPLRTPESRPESPLFQLAKITVLGTESLKEDETKAGTGQAGP